MFRINKRRLIGGAILILFVFLGAWVTLIEPSRLVVKESTVPIASWPAPLSGLRIAVISDIHAGSPFITEGKLQQIVTTTNQRQPDLIVLLGDYVTQSWFSRQFHPELMARGLRDLKAPLGVYAVLGNHDWWYDGSRVWRALEHEGIRVLENEVSEIQWRGDSFWLVGLSDAWTRPRNITETLLKVPGGKPHIALTHNPDLFPMLPATVALTLAGHTHGGQVNLPLLGRLVVPSDYGERYAAGHVAEKGRHLFVTTGIGTSVLPVRFRVPPEIVVLTIKH